MTRFAAEADTMAFERLIAQAALSEPGTDRSSSPQVQAAHAAFSKHSFMRDRNVELAACEPRQAANDLLGMWQGFWRIEVQYGHRSAPKSDELGQHNRHAIRQFIKLYSTASDCK